MPVDVVLENCEDRLAIDEMMESHDGGSREHVQAVLEFAAWSLEGERRKD